MKKRMILIGLVVVWMVAGVSAVQPNYVKSTVYGVGTDAQGASANLTVTSYSDGMGRSIQSKTALEDGTDRVVCTFYDSLGRKKFITKPFIDTSKPGSFLPGGFDVDGIVYKQLTGLYHADDVYASIDYYNDPLQRVNKSHSPGSVYTATWSFGVGAEDVQVLVSEDDTILGTVRFEDGFISDFFPERNVTLEKLTDGLSRQFRISNPFVHVADPGEQLTDGCRCAGEKEVGGVVHEVHNCINFTLSVARDQNGVLTQELADGFGHVIASRADPTQEATDGDEIISRIEYDLLGNVLREIAPKHNPHGDNADLIEDTEYRYNKLGQLVSKQTPDGTHEYYGYTGTGMVEWTRWEDDAGTVLKKVVNEYDVLDRLIAVRQVFEEGGDAHTLLTYYYDDTDKLNENGIPGIPAGLLTRLAHLKGRMVAQRAICRTGAQEYHIVDLFSYDDEGRISVKYKIVPGVPMQQTEYAYDLQGKKLKETMRCGTEVLTKRYRYDAEGRLKKIVHEENDKVLVEYSYNSIGLVDTTYHNDEEDFSTRYSYDVRDRMIRSTGNYFTQEFDYFPNSNISKIKSDYFDKTGTNVYATNYEYGYDHTNRLKSVNETGVQTPFCSYGYDEVGRFTGKTEDKSVHNDYLYYYRTNRLLHSKKNGKRYIYDRFGNMVIDLNKNMVVSYDWRNLPVRFTFYDKIENGEGKGIEFDGKGNYAIVSSACEDCDLDTYLDELVRNGDVKALSTVTMVYDVAGNRVLKIAGVQ